MIKKIILIPIASIVLLLTACDGSSKSSSSPSPIESLKKQVSVFVDEQLNSLQSLDCTTSSTCNDITVHFSEGSFQSNRSLDTQTILVLDDKGLEFPAITRYRSRIKAAYQLDSNGIFSPYDPAIQIPSFAYDILKQVDNFQDENNQPTFVPAKWLAKLSTRIYELDSDIAQNYAVLHGDLPLTYLLEHNPQANFVILLSPDFFQQNAASFCSQDISALSNAVSASTNNFYQNIILSESINYINFSGGYDLETVRSKWSSLCSQTMPSTTEQQALLNTIRPFYDVLFNTENVLGIQASSINMSEAQFPLDTDTSFNNRIRVGDYTNLDSQLPATGVIGNSPPPALFSSRHNSRQWIDLFINFGIEEVRPWTPNATPVMETNILGLDEYAITSIQPSWAAPVGLSRAIHAKNTQFPDEVLSRSLIERIKSVITPSGCSFHTEDNNTCKVQDPLLHKQDERSRLGY